MHGTKYIERAFQSDQNIVDLGNPFIDEKRSVGTNIDKDKREQSANRRLLCKFRMNLLPGHGHCPKHGTEFIEDKKRGDRNVGREADRIIVAADLLF